MKCLKIFADESGTVTTSNDGNHYGVGYFAITESVINSFSRELIKNSLGSIHMRELSSFEQKIKAIQKFVDIALKYPCFGGAYFHTKSESAEKIFNSSLKEVLEKEEFSHLKDDLETFLKKHSRLMQIYSDLSLFPFVHEQKSVYSGIYSTAKVEIGIIGEQKTFEKKLKIFLDQLLLQGNKEYLRYVKTGQLNNFKNIDFDFSLDSSTPMLGCADIFAYIGHLKTSNITKYNILYDIIRPILRRVKTKDHFYVDPH